MRVKRLEIQGFKSFKDNTTIHFDQGITGIVGPNGCGKSNIVDAFFWVMGEQSYKHMRGTGSEDLIFNGSSKYSPLGMAEATLVMETDAVDTEHAPAGASASPEIPVHLRAKEISVTRRLYRSGEGEYFINGVPARLKDIQELFMDTGVGAKGYSVIEQGQIGKIVNAKPEERRLLIEEAAGIAKYKARKKESLRKMEATQANLSRLTDVIQEIERTLGSLERQAQKARSYKKIKEELLDKEMTWGRRKAQVLRQRFEAIRSQKEALEQEILALRSALQVAENDQELFRVEQLTQTKSAEEIQVTIQNLSDELAKERSALELSQQRQLDLESQVNSYEAERGELKVSISSESERLSEQETQAQESDGKYMEASSRVQGLDEQVRNLRRDADEVRHKLESLKRELMQGMTQSQDFTNRGAALESRIETARARKEKLSDQILQQEAKLQEMHREKDRVEEALELSRSECSEQRTRVEGLNQTLRAEEQSLKGFERSREEAFRSLMQQRSRLQSLQELAQAHEGLADGPKSVLEWAQNSGSKGKLQTLADSIDVSEGFDVAVEAWLSGRLENLITDEATFAVSAFDQAVQSRQGRVSIQLGSSKTSSLMPFAKIETFLNKSGFGVVGELSKFVKVNSKLSPEINIMASALLAAVVVVDSFDPVMKLVDQGEWVDLGGWSVVSRDGKVLDLSTAAHLLRGGQTDQEESASLLKRKRLIAELESKVLDSEALLKHADEVCTQAAEQIVQQKTEIEKQQEQLQFLQVQGAICEKDVQQAHKNLKEHSLQLQLLKDDADDVVKQETQAIQEQETISSRLSEISTRRAALEGLISDVEAQFRGSEQILRQQEDLLQAARIEEAQWRERAQSLKRELESSRSLIADRQRRLVEVERSLERARHEREQFTGGESHLEQHIADLTRSLSDSREQLSRVKNQLELIQTRMDDAHHRIKQVHHDGETRQAESSQLAIEAEKISSDLAHLIQNLEEKYGPGCLERPVPSPIQEEMTEPVVTTEMTAEEEVALGEEVERLRERLRRLGDVNPDAVEQYEEQKKRYDYLLTEKADLERSIENLKEAIEHINKTSEERFKKAFEAIADRFSKLFPIIFGGGQASLSLVYPEGSTDILDAGVDILAQPPGKKIVNIGLLSGGEKALTAVSLIFAIFMVKPSPFCVLDEVDAPLDDANIGKFNALLREMSVKSQFILITHNKKTMELNDKLYGVTMEEPGVSKMVSIELH